jgi:diguanylate cyclase (GGDEF)-like protein
MQALICLAIGLLSGVVLSYIILSSKQKELRKKIYTDRLTGLKNANYLDDFFDQYLRSHTSYILIDIDNFKDFNTKFGYEIADEILKSFVDVMSMQFPVQKEIIRFKFGDEFLIILRNYKKKDALIMLNELSVNLNRSPIEVKKQQVPIYFSAGITSFKEEDTQLTVLSRLMNSLIDAKQEKNRFIIQD